MHILRLIAYDPAGNPLRCTSRTHGHCPSPRPGRIGAVSARRLRLLVEALRRVVVKRPGSPPGHTLVHILKNTSQGSMSAGGGALVSPCPEVPTRECYLPVCSPRPPPAVGESPWRGLGRVSAADHAEIRDRRAEDVRKEPEHPDTSSKSHKRGG